MRDSQRLNSTQVTRMSDLPLAPEIGDFYKIGSRTLFYNDGWNELA